VRASREAAAREARYAALGGLADELGCAAVLLGHTARDQAETVLLRILRGTGPAGLVGMAPVRGRFVRPLLDVRRADVEAYAAARALPIWDDPMNEDRAFARVRVRRDVMPMLARENPAIEDALGRLAASTAEWFDLVDGLARRYAWPVHCPALADAPPAIRKRVAAQGLEARGLGYAAVHLDAIDALIRAPRRGTVALDVPGGRVVRTYDALEIHASGSGYGSDAEAGSVPVVPPGHVLRTWLAGDRMRPTRLHGRSRKLSDLYADLKVPRIDRAGARVLVRISDDTVVWAEHVGHAIEADGSTGFPA
jgi:tRNA(Ile)-lysidine synthase